MDYSEFKCRWIDPVSLWNIADETRNQYWPESNLPVNIEEIVAFRLRLNIEAVKYLLSTVDIDTYLKRDLSGIVVDYDCYMNDKFANRMRFSFGHELGHFFLDTCIKLQYKRFNSKFMRLPMAIKQSVLTKRQAEILSFIKTHIQYSGFPPTISEIQGQFSFKSPNAVQEHIKALVRKGQIRRTPNQWRGLELMIPNKSRNEAAHYSTVSVPLIGRVTAGLPVLAEENYEGTISVDRSLVGRAARLFALHIRGDSMIKAGIYDGDIAVARQQSVADHGDIVIALLGDEATVKKFYRKNKVIILQPENDAMQPIRVSEGSDFKILGKVIATLHRIGNERAA